MNQATLLLKGLIPAPLRDNTLIYLGNQKVTEERWGDYLYLQTSYELVEQVFEKEGISVVIVEDDIYRIDISSQIYQKIIEPFLQGKYSEMDKEYVNEHFKRSFVDFKND